MKVEILVGDCREVLKGLPDQSVNCCVTSPPYFGLRDYGHGDQIGMESTPDEFVAQMVSVFREVRRVLKDDGTLWLNLGDSYSRSPAKGGSGPSGKNKDNWGSGEAQSAKLGSSDGAVGRGNRPGSRSGGLGEKQLLGIPWRVAFALQEDGWWLREDIIWNKPNPMPESVEDRCTRAHEYIFHLTKSAKYYHDGEAIKEDAVYPNDLRAPLGSAGAWQLDGRPADNNKGRIRSDRKALRSATESRHRASITGGQTLQTEPNGKRNKRSVWTVATKPFKEAHFATFPPDLIEPCILAGCPKGGVVLDPFGGSGTTGLVAKNHGRNAILIELNPNYVTMAKDRVHGPLFAGTAP